MQQLRRRPCSPFQQLDLWLVRSGSESGGAPGWSALPDQTQRTLAGLLTRLLMTHAGGAEQEGDSDER